MARQQQRDNLPCFTRFLDEREQRLAAIELRRQHFPRDQVCFWAGFDVPQEAPARRMLGLFPDYLALGEGMDRAILEEQFPIQRVALFFRAQDAITHRDILGSLMGLNLKIGTIGEILTGEDFAVVFCTGAAAQLILSELERVGRAGIKSSRAMRENCRRCTGWNIRQARSAPCGWTVRVSLATKLSREKSAALIEGGQVSLNFFEENKISREVGEGDILSHRGYGRYVLSKVGSVSKKGRLHLTLGKYV